MKTWSVLGSLFVLSLISCRAACVPVDRPPPMAASFNCAIETNTRVIDLTHPLTFGIPIYPGGTPFSIETTALLAKDGYYANKFTLGEHTGTHVDAPCHFVQGKCVDEIEPKSLFGPAVILSGREGYNFDLVDLNDWVRENGPIQKGSIIFFNSGWGKKWPRDEYVNRIPNVGIPSFPGYAPDVAEFLVQKKGAIALGIDTLSTDPGSTITWEEHRRVLALGAYHIENVANLDQLPPTGAWVVVAPLPIKGGSGAPARVLAFLPPQK